MTERRNDLPNTISRLLAEDEVCKYLGVSKVFLWPERKAGNISFRRCGGRVLYTEDDLREYVERAKTSALF